MSNDLEGQTKEDKEKCLLLLARTIPVLFLAVVCLFALLCELLWLTNTDPLQYWANVSVICILGLIIISRFQYRLLFRTKLNSIALTKRKTIAMVYHGSIAICFLVWVYALLQI